jgi:hypothetical protein
MSGFAKVVSGGEVLTSLRACFMGAKLVEWVRSQKMNLDKFALRWNLR